MFNWIIGIPLLTLFAAVGLAIVVITSSRHEPSRATLNALLVLMALWIFCSVMFHSISFPSTKFWLHFIMIFAACTGAVGVHFSAQFTYRMGRIAKWIVGIFYIAGAISIVLLLTGQIVEGAELLPNGAVKVDFAPLILFLTIMVTGMTLTAITFLTVAIISPLKRMKRHTIFPLIGFIAMCIGGLSNLIVSAYPIDIAANFIFISFLSYGVVRGRLLEPPSKLPWPQSLSLSFFLLALCYVAIFVFCQVWLGYTLFNANVIAALITFSFGSIVFGPVRKSLINVLERWLLPSTYRYRQALSRLAGLDTSLIRLESSITNALNVITDATHSNGAVLLLKNDKTGHFEATYAAGNDIVNLLQIKLPVDSPLVTHLGVKDAPLNDEEIKQHLNERVMVRGEDDIFRELGSTLYYVINAYSGPLAILAITRGSHERWNEDETKDFLKLACHQIATNIINAELYKASKREVKERKRVEEKVREADSLKELDRLRTELLANVSHELRTPLASIKGFSTMMLDYEKRLSAGDKRQYLKTIDQATDRLVGLIDQLLDMSRLEAGMLVLNKEPTSIRKLFKEIVAEAQVGSDKYRLILNLAKTLPKINIDPRRIRQVIDNLISNAIKYSAPETEVVISVQQVEDELLISVTDQGIGILKEDLPRVFERMFRSQKRQKAGAGGAGLGLSISKGIVEAHGGRIGIESEEGKGTKCFFTLPIR